MFEATAIKLAQEKDTLETIYEEAKENLSEGIAPTQEAEIEYLKRIRDKRRYQEERVCREILISPLKPRFPLPDHCIGAQKTALPARAEHPALRDQDHRAAESQCVHLGEVPGTGTVWREPPVLPIRAWSALR